MKRCGSGGVVVLVAVAMGIFFGFIFPAGFLVFLLCAMVFAICISLFSGGVI